MNINTWQVCQTNILILIVSAGSDIFPIEQKKTKTKVSLFPSIYNRLVTDQTYIYVYNAFLLEVQVMNLILFLSWQTYNVLLKPYILHKQTKNPTEAVDGSVQTRFWVKWQQSGLIKVPEQVCSIRSQTRSELSLKTDDGANPRLSSKCQHTAVDQSHSKRSGLGPVYVCVEKNVTFAVDNNLRA